MDRNTDFYFLIQGYIAQTLSAEEKELFLDFLGEPENVTKLSEVFADVFNGETPAEGLAYDKEKVEKMIRRILATNTFPPHYEHLEPSVASAPVVSLQNDEESKVIPREFRPRRSWLRYAAAVVLLAGAGLIYYVNKETITLSPGQELSSKTVDQNDVLPGANKAVLTLSNGKTIELSDNGKQLIRDGDITIENSEGALEYGKSALVAFNTMTTPRGGQYKLKLADGTAVWLNASSSITYPSAFPGGLREVSITGEVYFEVAKNPSKPFIVKTYKDEIMVRGTSFNVNSYTDEPGIKTSLLEGLVEINHTVLLPGYSYLDGKISPADLAKELAWKNGVFNLHHVKLTDAMRQIARWYDVDIKIDKRAADIELGGEIGRNLTLKQLLNGLEDKDIHFKLEGKVLAVY